MKRFLKSSIIEKKLILSFSRGVNTEILSSFSLMCPPNCLGFSPLESLVLGFKCITGLY